MEGAFIQSLHSSRDAIRILHGCFPRSEAFLYNIGTSTDNGEKDFGRVVRRVSALLPVLNRVCLETEPDCELPLRDTELLAYRSDTHLGAHEYGSRHSQRVYFGYKVFRVFGRDLYGHRQLARQLLQCVAGFAQGDAVGGQEAHEINRPRDISVCPQEKPSGGT